MAHYARKIRVQDPEKMIAFIKAAGAAFLYETTETDFYYKEMTQGQFQRLRRYDPPIPYSAHNTTGEAMPLNPVTSKHIETPADFILIHAQHTSRDVMKSDIGVLRCTSAEQADHIDDVMRMNRPFDMAIVKKRRAFWLDVDGVAVRIHLDSDVIDQAGKSHGAFIEFECKYQDPQHASSLSQQKAIKAMDKLAHDLSLADSDVIESSYYDVIKSSYVPKDSLLVHLPFAVTLDILKGQSFYLPKGKRLIAQYDRHSRDGYYIERGDVMVSYGPAQNIRQIGACDVVGEMAITTGIRTANVDAVSDISYKRLPPHVLESFTQEAPIMRHFIARLRADEGRRAQLRQAKPS